MVDAVDRIASGSSKDIDELRYLSNIVNAGSLCGLGQAAGNPAISVLSLFGAEMKKAAAGVDGSSAVE